MDGKLARQVQFCVSQGIAVLRNANFMDINYANKIYHLDLHEKASKDSDENYPFAKGGFIRPITYPTTHGLDGSLFVHPLVVILFLSGTRCQYVSSGAVLVGAVLE